MRIWHETECFLNQVMTVQLIGHQSDHYATEYAGLQRLEPEHHSLTCRAQIATRQGI